jgi:hypothetical protein
VKKWIIEMVDTADREKCTRQLALIASRKQRFHSSPRKEGRSTAGNAIKNIRDIDRIFSVIEIDLKNFM